MDRKKKASKVSDSAASVAEKVRDAKLDERAAEFAALAREKVRQAELDARAAEIAAKVRDSGVAEQVVETAAQVAEGARDAAETALERVNDWLVDTKVGDALGVQPPPPRRRRKPWALLTAGAVAAGVAAGLVLFRRKENQQFDEDWAASGFNTGDNLQPSSAPGVALPLEGRVREAIGADARTAALPALNINVVDGTVFVRGTVASDVDQEALRTVIQSVEGVTDVDLQVTVGT